MEGGPGFDGMNPVVQTMGGGDQRGGERGNKGGEGGMLVCCGCWVDDDGMAGGDDDNGEQGERAGKGYYLVCVCVVDLRGLRGWLVR